MMGSNQSNCTAPLSQEKLVEKLPIRHVDKDIERQNRNTHSLTNQVASPCFGPVSSHSQTVSTRTVEQWENDLLKDAKNQLAMAALGSSSVSSVLESREATIADTQTFNIRIPSEGSPVTNQGESGRCWLFASTNIFRIAIMKKYNLSSFQLSQSYLFYWDKIEKANYFLENVLKTASESIDSRLVQQLLDDPIQDAGQWDMVANLVNKYGLVPHHLFPDPFNASDTAIMDQLLTTKLREYALRLRELVSSTSTRDLATHKEKMLREIHCIVTLMLGTPPSPHKSFTWEFYDSSNTFRSVTTTPLKFAQELSDPKTIRTLGGTNVHTLFSLVNDPRNPYYRLLSVKSLGNVFEGRPITYVNVDMATMKKACIAMLQCELPVFFGSDVRQYCDEVKGVLDTRLYDFDLAFNTKFVHGMSKAERLQSRESQMTHAMVLTGVHVVDGKSVRWRIENSFSIKTGDKGYFVMADDWMDEFVYQAVVDPRFVSADIRDVLKQEPMMLDLWDPMGALAS